MVRFDFVELFAGIGGFRLALEAVGGRCVLASEYSQHACAVYRRNWPNDPGHVLVGDVRRLVPAQIPPHDVLVGGFPCQCFSGAGEQRGLGDDGRGHLYLEVCRLLCACRPAAFVLENVPEIMRHNEGQTWATCLGILHAAHFHTQHVILDAVHWAPQRRRPTTGPPSR